MSSPTHRPIGHTLGCYTKVFIWMYLAVLSELQIDCGRNDRVGRCQWLHPVTNKQQGPAVVRCWPIELCDYCSDFEHETHSPLGWNLITCHEHFIHFFFLFRKKKMIPAGIFFFVRTRMKFFFFFSNKLDWWNADTNKCCLNLSLYFCSSYRKKNRNACVRDCRNTHLSCSTCSSSFVFCLHFFLFFFL